MSDCTSPRRKGLISSTLRYLFNRNASMVESWWTTSLKIVAVYRFVPRRNGEKYRFTFQAWSINYFRDPRYNVAFLFSLGQFLAGNVPRI